MEFNETGKRLILFTSDFTSSLRLDERTINALFF